MKRRDIQSCIVCKKGMMHSMSSMFFRTSIDYMFLDMGAIRRQAGLEMTIGSAAIAAAMEPDEDLAVPVGQTSSLCVCMDCAMSTPIAVVYEQAKIADEKETDE